MKYFWVSALLLSAACGGSSTKGSSSKSATPSCGANGVTRCSGTVIQSCDGTQWTDGQDCAATKALCVVSTSTSAAACVAQGSAGATCSTTPDCASGLECSIASGATTGTCIALCNPAASTCGGTTPFCIPADSSNGLCEPAVTDGQLCLADVQCPADAHTCHYFRRDVYGALTVPTGVCAGTCAFAEINHGQGSCAAGFDCLQSPWLLDTQLTSGNPTHCTADTDCAQADGYTCLTSVQGGQYCARPVGVCGHPLPMFATLPNTSAPDFDVSTLCGGEFASVTDYRNFCGVTDPAATVKPVCVSFDGYLLDMPYAGLCMSRCTPGVDDCGAGYTCQAPDVAAGNAILMDPQLVNGQPVACTLKGNTCSSPYACGFVASGVSMPGLYCARAVPVCTKT